MAAAASTQTQIYYWRLKQVLTTSRFQSSVIRTLVSGLDTVLLCELKLEATPIAQCAIKDNNYYRLTMLLYFAAISCV